MAAVKDHIVTDSGIVIAPIYRESDRDAPEPDPGCFPYTRGIYPTMYRGRRWTMRQYAGFSSVEESNARYRLLLERGTTGLSVAFDLPTQLGLDSDDERAQGEVGRVGVPISTVDDMRRLFDGIDQGAVTTSMTINAPAALLLLMYEIVAEERGVDPTSLGGTIQNDILKEYAARGTYIFPPRPSMRLVTDTFAYCTERLPAWNTISVSGYHMREAGSSAAQEIAFTVANGLAYIEAALAAGLRIDQVAPRMSFFFSAHSDLFEEVAKFRAARRLWAHLIRERYSPRDPRSEMVRFHTQTGGVTLTAQQPLNNVVRVAYQALSAVLGGTQSLHTNSYDEALGLPTQDAATLALRTQQILADETGVPRTADPLAGSYFVESLTDEVEERAREWLRQVEARGGAVVAIENGFIQNAIAENAFRREIEREQGEEIIVGVNRYVAEESVDVPLQVIDEDAVHRQVERVRAHKSAQDWPAVERTLSQVAATAKSGGNLLPQMRDSLRAGATLGQVTDALRSIFGDYRAHA
ncbi:MAG: methylmalonyl-CoA mutase, large subunit [Thermomicrobiales bacterium]|nr:methylmalonyl-CoA mutase, large subunit [Thermomicrobiales bacterium]